MENTDRRPHVGDSVVYHNAAGAPHSALITAVWGPSCVNVVFVSNDPSKGDQYGRQIERETSVSHVGPAQAHGRYWRWPDEEANGYVAPTEA